MIVRPMFRLPCPVYPIVDCDAASQQDPLRFAISLLEAGVPLLQLRAKSRTSREFLALATEIATACAQHGAQLVINDRPDIALLAGAAGVHLGQEDIPPDAVRPWFGRPRIIGWSTHNLTQAVAAASTGLVDYIGVGPIFSTSSKANPDPVVGLALLGEIRAAVQLPIVAIGGISEANAQAVLDAGADAVAMISAIARAPEPGAFVRRLLDTLVPQRRA
ncbi:MAG: thiamine phosphate synthase [Candidatus Binatia bacterium]|nr:thiamine phosphate synthase [Candidatus Binatia bacterium]